MTRINLVGRGRVVEPPSGATILWATEWANSTGDGLAARTDGARLGDLLFDGGILSVVTKASVGGLPESWPTNLLRITFQGVTSQLVSASGVWAAPAANETIAFRFLAYNNMPDESGVANEHGMQTSINYQQFWQFFSPEEGQAPGTSYLGFAFGDGLSTGTNVWATIPHGRPMRHEWLLTRAASGVAATVEIRVTDESTGTVYTNANFLGNWGEGPDTPLVAALTTPVALENELDGFRSYMFGASGSSGGTGVSMYITGFAVGTDWIGPYTGREDI